MKVVDSAGKALTTTAATPVTVPAGGGVLKGQLDLSGLPPGQYTMAASLNLGGKTVERSATFTMAGLDETLEKDVARRDAAKGTDEGYFEAMDDKALDAAKEPLVLIAESGELSKYSKDLSLRGQAAVHGRVLAEAGPDAEHAGERDPPAVLRRGGLRRPDVRREGPGGRARLEDGPRAGST